MQYAGVISAPGKNSLSPAFQQAAFDHLGIAVKYEHWPTPADGLETRVVGLQAPDVLGANVTIPHKEACLPLVDDYDPLVRRVGALNTIHNDGGTLRGYNTDVEGFLRPLKDAFFEPRGCTAVIAGAGGAARAVVIALAEAGAARIAVVNRTLERAERLVADLGAAVKPLQLVAAPDSRDSWQKAAAEADLLVNCTSLGTAGTPEEDRSPMPANLLRPQALVYDLVYQPAETRLIRYAREAGARTIGGLPMLIYQGAASFKLWTGRDAPVDIMFQAAEAALAAEDAS
ncbi:MAG: shikimate dehydrogenase [Chloroflexi bacterium]|nr:shikimate dehydrogenase [Chloroflexota bacterium]MCI0882785.1 shikimate dehydrogenase [Chloroflexota bacterium]